MNFSIYLLLIIGTPALLFLGAVVLYVFFVQANVKWWFGETGGHRRDHEAIRRRRSFENQCFLAAKMLYVTWVVGVAQGFVDERLPDHSGIFWALRVAMFLVAAFFAYGAYSRWRTPTES
jgi:hypothetical protein